MEFGINILTYVLDDEKVILNAIDQIFKESGFTNYTLFNNPDEFLAAPFENVHICIVDYILKGYPVSGLDVMIEILKRNPICYVIAISSQTDIDVVISFLNHGAFKYINKLGPRFIEDLTSFVEKACEYVRRDYTLYNNLIQKQLKVQRAIDKIDPSLNDKSV